MYLTVRSLWADIAAGQIKAEPFGLNDKWVPWYNIHKIYAGLRDAWIYAGNGGCARHAHKALADWSLSP